MEQKAVVFDKENNERTIEQAVKQWCNPEGDYYYEVLAKKYVGKNHESCFLLIRYESSIEIIFAFSSIFDGQARISSDWRGKLTELDEDFMNQKELEQAKKDNNLVIETAKSVFNALMLRKD